MFVDFPHVFVGIIVRYYLENNTVMMILCISWNKMFTKINFKNTNYCNECFQC